MLIKSCLYPEQQKYERLRYPETYWSTQIKSAEKILEFFKDVSLDIKGEKALEVRLENKNTVIIMPLKGSKIISPAESTGIPETHKTEWGKDSLTIKPKKKFEKEFPQTLIIRRFFWTFR